MVAEGAGTEESCLKHLNYKTTDKTVGRSCNKSTSTKGLFTM